LVVAPLTSLLLQAPEETFRYAISPALALTTHARRQIYWLTAIACIFFWSKNVKAIILQTESSKQKVPSRVRDGKSKTLALSMSILSVALNCQ
ncbi:MAG: hypothetical protein P8077_04530, partial [Gammaproteobacteria bacterium]